jgi:hypothetical protein
VCWIAPYSVQSSKVTAAVTLLAASAVVARLGFLAEARRAVGRGDRFTPARKEQYRQLRGKWRNANTPAEGRARSTVRCRAPKSETRPIPVKFGSYLQFVSHAKPSETVYPLKCLTLPVTVPWRVSTYV